MLQMTGDQVIELLRQWPAAQGQQLFQLVIEQQWPEWVALAREGQAAVRAAAAVRGLDWDTMGDEDRLAFMGIRPHLDNEQL